jgi:hypothetical protein
LIRANAQQIIMRFIVSQLMEKGRRFPGIQSLE